MKIRQIIILSIIFFILSLFSCGFTINDLIFDYNSNFDQTPIMKFISNGQVNPNAIIQEEEFNVKKEEEGGQNLVISSPAECESFEWKISPNICDELNIATNKQTLTLPVDLMTIGEYQVSVRVFYHSDSYSDSCIVNIY